MPVKNTDKARPVGKIKHNFSFQVSDKGGIYAPQIFSIFSGKKSSNKM